MNVNPGSGREELSTGWVKGRLRAMAAVEPPRSLRDRVLAGIPGAPSGLPAGHCVRPWWKTQWAGVAAAVFVVASAVAWLGIPWRGPMRSSLDANSNPGRVYATDHNSLGPSDTNLCDINSIR
jgi:hypothetical protein